MPFFGVRGNGIAKKRWGLDTVDSQAFASPAASGCFDGVYGELRVGKACPVREALCQGGDGESSGAIQPCVCIAVPGALGEAV